MKKTFKEPLIYFFILGFVVFGLHSFLNRENQNKNEDPFTVEITSADIEWVRSSWEARMKRQPTQQELQGLMNTFIRNEILQREALAMDLDVKDLVIQRRLVQKLTFVFEDLAETIEPTDDELKKYLQENQEKYRISGIISFSHIYFNPDKRKNVHKDIKSVLDQLKSAESSSAEVASLGDVIMMDSSFRKRSPAQVTRTLGKDFSDILFSSEEMGWQGPIFSTFGLHLVYIKERIASQMPEFEQIREDIKRDFMYNRKNEVIDTAYNAAKSHYTILVEGLPHE